MCRAPTPAFTPTHSHAQPNTPPPPPPPTDAHPHAHSEKWNTKHEIRDAHIAEMTNINLSLHTLGRCISSLAARSLGKVPSRRARPGCGIEHRRWFVTSMLLSAPLVSVPLGSSALLCSPSRFLSSVSGGTRAVPGLKAQPAPAGALDPPGNAVSSPVGPHIQAHQPLPPTGAFDPPGSPPTSSCPGTSTPPSRLTAALQDSLGGNARTFLIATIAPSRGNAEESISTLKFADRAKQVSKSQPPTSDRRRRSWPSLDASPLAAPRAVSTR